MNDDIDDSKGLPEESKIKTLGISPEPIKSDLVAYGANQPDKDLSKIADNARATNINWDAYEAEAEVLSEEYKFDLFDVSNEEIEQLKVYVAIKDFDGHFYPVDTYNEDNSITENDISVIDDSFLDYQLPLWWQNM